MTPEELERVMNFIIERQERFAEAMQQTQAVLATLVEHDSDKEKRIARFERSYVAISDLLVSHDSQLVAITDGINDLTSVVNRYITARGNSNGSNGTNGQG